MLVDLNEAPNIEQLEDILLLTSFKICHIHVGGRSASRYFNTIYFENYFRIS